MSTLFLYGIGGDDAYIELRDDPQWRKTRVFIEALWKRYERCADPNFRTEMPRHCYERFWEMYLFCSLEEMGHTASCPKPGPDVLIEYDGQRIWFEAVAPTGGLPGKPDSVPDDQPGPAQDVPDDEVILRMQTAIQEKYSNKYGQYRKSNIILENDVYVIAINGSQIPFKKAKGGRLPRIVRAVFPIGDLQIVIDIKSSTVVNEKYKYRPNILKKGGSKVSTKIFLDDTYKYLSAVLYSNVDPFNGPWLMGTDYTTVHNPIAANRLPRGLVKRGQEYWSADGGKTLRWEEHKIDR